MITPAPPELNIAHIIEVFNRHEVEYVVIGGAAAEVWAASVGISVRPTLDIDFTPNNSRENLFFHPVGHGGLFRLGAAGASGARQRYGDAAYRARRYCAVKTGRKSTKGYRDASIPRRNSPTDENVTGSQIFGIDGGRDLL